MTLVDTSVWVEFLHGHPGATRLATLLERGEVLVHPWVVGELTLGAAGKQRVRFLADMGLLPQAAVLTNEETLEVIVAQQLAGRGVGWVDANLLGSALLSQSALWTRDRNLGLVVRAAGLAG